MIGSPLMWVSMLAPLAFVMVQSFGINKLSTTAAQAIFWAYAAVMGLSMSTIFLAFTATSIAQTFFATAAAFLGLSLYGYTKIGRESCRERVCQYVESSVVAVSLKKNIQKKKT